MTYKKKEIDLEAMSAMIVALNISPRKLSPEPSCDFCGAQPPKWVYAAARMSTGMDIENWRWAACDPCSKAIDEDDWATIESRVMERLHVMMGRFMPVNLIRVAVQHALTEFRLYAIKTS